MNSSLDNEHHRPKRRKIEKFEESILQSLVHSLFGNKTTRKRKISRSSSSSTLSVSNSPHGHHDKENRGRGKRERRYRASSHRKRRTSRVDNEDAPASHRKTRTSRIENEHAAASHRSVENTASEVTKKVKIDERKSNVTAALKKMEETSRIVSNERIIAPDAETEAIKMLQLPLRHSETNEAVGNAAERKETQESCDTVAEPKKMALVVGTKKIKDSSGHKTKEEAAKWDKNQRNETKEVSMQAIYRNLVNSWENIIQQGLSTEGKDELLDKYRIPDDYQRFKGPVLNLALKSLLSGVFIVRDEIEIAQQNQLGSLMIAIEKGVNCIVNGDTRSSGLARIVETMNDAASIIAQLHYSISIARRKRVAEEFGVERIKIVDRVSENLFSKEEEAEILERKMLEKMDEEVEKRLATAKEEEEALKQTEENESVPQENQEEEKSEIRCSQRLEASRNSQLVQAKIEAAKGVKSEGRVEAKQICKSHEFVSFSDYPGVMELTRQVRLRQGFAEEIIPVTMNSIAPSTLKLYNKHLHLWWDFCHRESVDIAQPLLRDVTAFLSEYFMNGATIATLEVARAALSWLTVTEWGKNKFLGMLYKAFKKPK